MAVIKGARGIEVQVLCDGQPLQEYHDPDVEEIPRTATRYIEAKTGKAFVIRCKFAKETRFRGDCIACALYLDGHWIWTPLIRATFKTKEEVEDIDGAPIAEGRQCPLLFSELMISEYYPPTNLSSIHDQCHAREWARFKHFEEFQKSQQNRYNRASNDS
jgi:hypothetical protein